MSTFLDWAQITSSIDILGSLSEQKVEAQFGNLTLPVADLGGNRLCPQSIFSFHAVFGKIMPSIRLAPPLLGLVLNLENTGSATDGFTFRKIIQGKEACQCDRHRFDNTLPLVVP